MADELVKVRHGTVEIQVSADQVEEYLKANPGAERVEEAEDEPKSKGKGKRSAKEDE